MVTRGIVLVTGGSGVLGRAVTQRFLNEGFSVRILDTRPPPFSSPGVSFIQGDIREEETVRRAMEGCQRVIHLAGVLPQARLREKEIRAINIGGTEIVARTAIQFGVERLVFASTIEIYGPQRILNPLTEEAEMRFTGLYSRTKYESEELLKRYGVEKGLPWVSLRLPMIMGPGFYHEKTILALMWFIRRGFPLLIPNPEIPVSFVDVEDAALAFFLASELSTAVGKVFNISAPDTPTLKEFLSQLIARVGSSSRIWIFPPGIFRGLVRMAIQLSRLTGGKFLGTPAELIPFALTGGAYSIERARTLLGYHPQHTCASAWERTYRWFFSLPFSRRLRIFFRG